MALLDSILGLVTKSPKDLDAPKPSVGSRSEREARIKDRAGMVISIFALLLAVNAWYGGKLSSTVLTTPLVPTMLGHSTKPKPVVVSATRLLPRP